MAWSTRFLTQILPQEAAATAEFIPPVAKQANPEWSVSGWVAAIAASGRFVYPPAETVFVTSFIEVAPARFNPEWSQALWYGALASVPRINFPPIVAATAATAQVRMLASLGVGS